MAFGAKTDNIEKREINSNFEGGIKLNQSGEFYLWVSLHLTDS